MLVELLYNGFPHVAVSLASPNILPVGSGYAASMFARRKCRLSAKTVTQTSTRVGKLFGIHLLDTICVANDEWSSEVITTPNYMIKTSELHD